MAEHPAGTAPVRSYRDLRVWQQSMDLAEETYRATEQFPKHERYGLVSQLRRAAVSVASNIAEGHSRSGGVRPSWTHAGWPPEESPSAPPSPEPLIPRP